MRKNGRLLRHTWSYSIKYTDSNVPAALSSTQTNHRGHWVWNCVIRNCTSGVGGDHRREKPGLCIILFCNEISKSDPPKTMMRWRFQRFLDQLSDHRKLRSKFPGPPTSTPIARCHGRCIRHPKRCWTTARWSIRCPGRIRGFGVKVGWYPWMVQKSGMNLQLIW